MRGGMGGKEWVGVAKVVLEGMMMAAGAHRGGGCTREERGGQNKELNPSVVVLGEGRWREGKRKERMMRRSLNSRRNSRFLARGWQRDGRAAREAPMRSDAALV